MNTHPLIVFSGGMDSTVMLHRFLQQGDVHVCYFKAAQHWDKIDLELSARKKIIEHLTNLTGNRVLSDTIVEMKEVVTIEKQVYGDFRRSNNVPDKTWGQAYLWLFGLIYVSDASRHSKICLGNVMGDSIALHLDNIAAAWSFLQRFTKGTSVPLEFPLSLWTKDGILDALPREIAAKTWVCELPEEGEEPHIRKACGKCAACKTLMKTIWMWEHTRGLNYRKYIEASEEVCSMLDEGKTL
jgi:7-cyano-7-deazaguanine synthase in queuosine biosynthesis